MDLKYAVRSQSTYNICPAVLIHLKRLFSRIAKLKENNEKETKNNNIIKHTYFK